MLLEKKNVLVTGASRGIGKAIARKFAQEGAVVYAQGRMPGTIEEWAREISGDIRPLYFDVTDNREVERAFQKIGQEASSLDVLVNNAGTMPYETMQTVTRETMEAIFQTNFFAVVNIIQRSVELMTNPSGGSIINMTSTAAIYGAAGRPIYASSKGAIITLTQSCAQAYNPQQIRVNAIAPGYIDTDMFRSVGSELIQWIIDDQLKRHGVDRIGTPEDVANAALFLASDLSSYITGQVLAVDGGMTP
ncbi:MAG: SDR family oxidoreductase [Planctomycetia bacterium]|nr:SDR family oxidoreductase [Planctomycetia bacterium]